MAITTIGTNGIADNTITGAKVALASQAAGDVMYYNGTDWLRVGVGTDGQVLTVNNAENAPGWEAASAGATLSGSTNNTVVTVTGSNAMIGEANLTFDGTNLTVGTGNVIIGTAGKGIDFSAQTGTGSGTNVSVGTELLSHYEEGTWRPGISDSSLDPEGDDKSQGYSIQAGHYTRVGRLVTITGSITMTSLGSMDDYTVMIVGLPFTCKNVANYSASVHFGNGSGLAIGDNHSISGVIIQNRAYISMKEWDSTVGVASALTINQLSADGHLEFSASYIV